MKNASGRRAGVRDNQPSDRVSCDGAASFPNASKSSVVEEGVALAATGPPHAARTRVVGGWDGWMDG